MPLTFTVGQRVQGARGDLVGTVVEIPEGRGYVWVQWDDQPTGNIAGEWFEALRDD